MLREKLSKIISLLKKSHFYKKIEWFYGKIIHVLFLWKWMPKILAYGGIHLVLLIVLGIQAYFMWKDLDKNNVTSFNQIVYRFYGDTLDNYRLNYLDFEKDMRRRPGDAYNENDIVLSYGFILKDTTKRKKVVKLKYKGDYNKNSDLISKVRYLTCNNIPDTIIKKKPRPYYLKSQKQIQETKYVSNHDRYYYDISTIDDSAHVFKHITNAKDRLIEWNSDIPHFSFWLGFVFEKSCNLNSKSKINIKFNDFTKDVMKEGYRRPLIVDKILPQPTISNLKWIVYEGEELKSVIQQGGIYISGVDPEKEEIIEKKNLFSTVLIGTIIAFMLDIIVQLVLKWRKLRDYK